MSKPAYSELLRDPRWQRKRLEIMKRASFACEECGATTKTLNVHHVKYVRGRKPWEYADAELRCLCEPCHGKEHGIEPAPQRKRKPRNPEMQAIADRMSEIDKLFPLATNDERNALLYEKMELSKQANQLRRGAR